MNVEEQPFLRKSDAEELKGDTKAQSHLLSCGSQSFQYGIHAVLLIIWTLAAVALSISYRAASCYTSPRRYTVNGTDRHLKLIVIVLIGADLRDIKVQYHTTKYLAFQDSPYVGPPTPEVDDAWGQLMMPMAIRVSEAELIAGEQRSVKLPDGGYLAWLGVYHELHCIVRCFF